MQQRSELKRRRLVRAAARRVHRKGFHRTTLMDVAREARLPPGGLYYYFRTKQALVEAIAEARLEELEARFGTWTRRSPCERLEALIELWDRDSEIDARYGCPIGSLCYELAKGGGSAAQAASRPLRRLQAWCVEQFAAGGSPDPEGDAEHLTMALQGASLVANALRDPQALRRETARLRRWLQGRCRRPS